MILFLLPSNIIAHWFQGYYPSGYCPANPGSTQVVGSAGCLKVGSKLQQVDPDFLGYLYGLLISGCIPAINTLETEFPQIPSPRPVASECKFPKSSCKSCVLQIGTLDVIMSVGLRSRQPGSGRGSWFHMETEVLRRVAGYPGWLTELGQEVRARGGLL